MTTLILLDTDILIDVGRAENNAIQYLKQLEKDGSLALSAISHMELIVGCRNKVELNELSHFLQRFHTLTVNEVITEKAVELLSVYRLSHGLLIADALIAATAITHNLAFATKNQRHFRFISSLNLLAYPTLTA